jgi:hypothetical protein
MEIKLYPTIQVNRLTENTSVNSPPRKNFRFKGKIIHARHSGEKEPGKYVITITTNNQDLNISELLNRDIIVTSE